jgi:hypothetical protein
MATYRAICLSITIKRKTTSTQIEIPLSLRPRYSLLTLLVVTALVAGGVKAWFGPWRVLERPTANVEIEYTYTRDWRFNKIIQGPRVTRIDSQLGEQRQINLAYYRHGNDIQQYRFVLVHDAPKKYYLGQGVAGRETLPLTTEERDEYDRALQRECEHLHTQGFSAYKDSTPDLLQFPTK